MSEALKGCVSARRRGTAMVRRRRIRVADMRVEESRPSPVAEDGLISGRRLLGRHRDVGVRS